MRILLISNMYPDKDHPNYGVFVQNTERILVESGHKVSHIVMYKKKSKVSKIINYIKYYWKILLICFVRKYDCVYVHYAAHNSIPLLLIKNIKKKIKIITNVHGSDVVPETKIHMFLQKYVKKLLQSSNLIITPSNYYKNLVQQKYELSNRIEVFPSGGVNSNTFFSIKNKKKLFEKYNLDPNKKYLGYVGRIDYGKGWDILLNSINLLNINGFMKDKKVIIVGDGNYREVMRNLIVDYGIEELIINYDLLNQNSLNEIYNLMDVFCFPTMREGESLGLVGLEAMACGVPIIGSSIGGLLDYIDDGNNGLLFSVGDSEDLKRRIIEFFNYPEEIRSNMSEKCIVTAGHYNVNEIKDKLLNIFTSIRR